MGRCRLYVYRYASGHRRCAVDCLSVPARGWHRGSDLSTGSGIHDRKKAANMARMMNILVLGLVENMSFYKCPDCGRTEEIFGKSKLPQIAKEMGLIILGRIPIDSKLAGLCDEGAIERTDVNYLDEAVSLIEKRLPVKGE